MAALLIPGLVFFTALVLVAIANTQNVTTKSQTEASGSILQFFKDAITGKAAVHAITQLTRAAISRWALAQLKPVTAWFVAFNSLLLNIFRTQTDVIEGTAQSLERMRGHTIPHAAAKAAAPATKQAKSAQAKANQASSTAKATSTSFTHYRSATAPKIAHATHAVDVAIPQQLGRIRTRTNTLERGQVGLRDRVGAIENGAIKTFEWIRSHPLSAAAGVFAGAVTVALSRLGFGFLRCRSWQRLGRSLTCSQADNIGALLGLAATAAVISDFRELVKIAQAVEHETASGIHALLDL